MPDALSGSLNPACFEPRHIGPDATDQRRMLAELGLESLEQLADYGRRFYEPGDRKIVLNFALARGVAVDPTEIRRIYSPEAFMVKLTPVNPTDTAVKNGYETILSGAEPHRAQGLVSTLEDAGFECVISIGDDREIAIGSNCGQAASVVLKQEAQGLLRPRKDGAPASTP